MRSSDKPRSVLRRIKPWWRRHPTLSMAVCFTAGGFQLGVGLVLLSLGQKAGTEEERRKAYGFSAGFLMLAALSLVGGLTNMALARTPHPRD